MSKWNVAVYLRLSSDDGDKMESNSITNQKSLIKLFLKKEKNLKIYDYYIDDGFSGTDFNRPDFQRLLKDMKEGKINTIIVKDLSRLGRNYIEVGNYIEQVFPLYDVRFIAINDNVDSYKDPKSVSNVIVPFKNLMNDEYARDISNKVKSVLNTKKINGQFTGLSAPFGYLKDPKNKHNFIVDKKASMVVKKIFRMILNGKSKREVVTELNKCCILPPALYKMNENIVNSRKTNSTGEWNTEMVDRILKNESYTGNLIQGKQRRISHKIHKLVRTTEDEWIIVPNHHTALISKEEFEQVQDIIYNRENRIKGNEKYDVFSGHLKCYDCGNNFTIKKGNSCEYYYCNSYIRDKKCSKHSISKKKLEDIVLQIINTQINLVIDIDSKISEIVKEKEVNYDIEILENRIKEIDEKIEKYQNLKKSIKEDYENKYISKEDYIEYEKDYSNLLNTLNRKKDYTKEELEKNMFKIEKSRNWKDKFIENQNLEKLTKKVVDELIDNIYIYENGNIDIVFKYKNEFFEAINFIKSHNCDIIKKVV